MSHLKDSDILELKDRYLFLIEKYALLSRDLAPKLDELGRYRKELQMLVSEFQDRGAKIDDPEYLKSMIEEELNKRPKDDGQ